MGDPNFDQISATTLADMREDVVTDCFFVDCTTLRALRSAGALDSYRGGTAMVETFMYNRVNGGAVSPGADVNVSQVQILAATNFAPKKYVEQIPLNKWQTQVINSGPAAKVRIAHAYFKNAMMSINTDLGIDIWRHGQANSGTAVKTNRALYINGFSEAMNDGVTNSWDGNVFTTYGSQTRNGAIGNVLNSVPIWLGDQAGKPGQVTYKAILESQLDAVNPPDKGVCNKAFYSYLLERQETKQRYQEEYDPEMGLRGIKVLGATIFVDKLAPSTKYGTLLPQGLSQTTAISPSNFTSAASPSSISNLPASTTITPGEVFFWLRTDTWKVRPSDDPDYNFGLTPPIYSQTNPDLIVSFLNLGINIYTLSPRDNYQVYGGGF